MLISGGLDQNIHVWDISNGKPIRTLNNHTRPVHEIVLRPSQSTGLPMLASASDDRTVRLWQPTIGRMVRFARLDAVPLALAWWPDGSKLAVSTAAGECLVLDPDTIGIIHRRQVLDGWAYAIAVHPEDESVIVGGQDGRLVRVELPP